MQIRRRAAAALLTVAALGLTACSSSDAVTDVDPKAAVEVLAEEQPAVLDVRTPAEFAEGHLPGAVNIDVESPDFADRVGELPKDTTYFVYCRSGNRSGVATNQMVDLGFTDLYDLQGGIVEWQAEGGAVNR